MESKIKNGSRSGPDSLPVQTRMSLFQIAALKAIAAMDGINSATLLRNLADKHIEHCLTSAGSQDRELLLRLLDRGGFRPDVSRILGATWNEAEMFDSKEYFSGSFEKPETPE